MKNILKKLVILSSLLLSSCSFFFFDTGEAKSIPVYDLDIVSENGDISQAELTPLNARFLKNKEYVPYISLKQYASLYKSRLLDGFDYSVHKSGSFITWEVYNNELGVYYMSRINPIFKEISVMGSIQETFKPTDYPIDLRALNYGLQSEYSSVVLGSRGYNLYDFSDYDVKYFSYNGEYYFPLSFLDLTYSEATGIYHYYNYAGIYACHDIETYANMSFTKDDKTMTVDTEMASLVKEESMPFYLKEFNANMFFYVMDNFYGLKDYKGYSSMEKLCRKKGLYDYLLSNKAAERAQAYADALSILDDNHTAIASANDSWGENDYVNFRYATGCLARHNKNVSLTNARATRYASMNKNLGEPILSNDGKTAMYYFNQFVYGDASICFNEDGSLNLERAATVDSFFELIKLFNDLSTQSVENVILDISTNGGGVLGVLMKILCLLSKDNSSYISYFDDNAYYVAIASSQININGDNLYNANDCFGNRFDFYLLTSDCSFSCANAFPCLAKQFNVAKIIGQTSGGGECVVGGHYLPNSQYVYHSSNLHLGYYDDKDEVFYGFENGAVPDYPINDDNQFYDIEYLNQLIKN